MKKYVALLRGINVSGKNMIKMNLLTELCERLGLTQVKTYIQSGNIVFQSNSDDRELLEKLLQEVIFNEFTYAVPVKVFEKSEWDFIANNNFYLKNNNIEISNLHVTLLAEKVDKLLIDRLLEVSSGNDSFQYSEQTIYLHCPDGYGRTKLTNNFFENKLKVKATTRNWKTVLELQKMLEN